MRKFLETIDKLLEMPVFDDESKVIGKRGYLTPFDTSTVERIKKGKILKTVKLNGIEISVYDKNDNKFVMATKNNELVGVLEMYNFGKYPFPKVVSSYVYEDYQGKRIGSTMYDLAVKSFGGLVSDAQLTGETGKGSFDTWMSLGKKYKTSIVNRTTGKQTPVKEFSRSMMGKLGNGDDKQLDELFCVQI